MSRCLSPVPMYRLPDGSISHDCHKIPVASRFFRPCQYCIGCRLNHAETWAVRMVNHAQLHEQNSFLTLTYSDDKLPPGNSLRYSDVTKFIKRARRAGLKFTYYRVGEYGDQLSRPHYHLIFFGYDFTDPVQYHQKDFPPRDFVSQKEDRSYYKSDFLNECWGHGFADIGNVDFSTCMYVAKYITKKIFGAPAVNHYLGRLPEKSSCSHGIGASWLEQYWTDVYPDDTVMHNSKRYRPPRYYDNWLEKNNKPLFDQIKQSREASATEHPDYQRLANSHFIQIQKQKSFKRDGSSTPTVIDEALHERTQSRLAYFHLQGKSHD